MQASFQMDCFLIIFFNLWFPKCYTERAGKVNQILCSDLLPVWTRWIYISCYLGIFLFSRAKTFSWPYNNVYRPNLFSQNIGMLASYWTSSLSIKTEKLHLVIVSEDTLPFVFLHIVCALGYDVSSCHLPVQFLALAQFLAVCLGRNWKRKHAWTIRPTLSFRAKEWK